MTLHSHSSESSARGFLSRDDFICLKHLSIRPSFIVQMISFLTKCKLFSFFVFLHRHADMLISNGILFVLQKYKNDSLAININLNVKGPRTHFFIKSVRSREQKSRRDNWNPALVAGQV